MIDARTTANKLVYWLLRVRWLAFAASKQIQVSVLFGAGILCNGAATAAVFPIGTPSIQNLQSSVLNSFTVPVANNRLLIVVAAHPEAGGVSSVAYGSTPMMRAIDVVDTAAVNSIWMLPLGSGSAVTNNITVSLIGADPSRATYIAAAAFANVDQTTPFSNAAADVQNVGTNVAINTPTGDLAFDAVLSYWNNGFSTPLPGAGQALILSAGANGFSFVDASQLRVSSKNGPSSFMSWSDSGDATLLHVGLNIRQFQPILPCVPATVSGCTTGDRISKFSLTASLTNDSDIACSSSPAGYSDYTDTIGAATLLQTNGAGAGGNTFSGYLKAGRFDNYATIWIDVNDNGVFEDSERLLDNLPIGPTEKLYGIFVPNTVPLGPHRLRVRTIGAQRVPTVPTDACASYPSGETEDYAVIIEAGSQTRSAASATNFSCVIGAEMTIGASSNNNGNSYVWLVDANGDYIAGVRANGNELGRVQSSFYKHTSQPRQDAVGRSYLGRNVAILPDRQPTLPYDFRFPFSTTERADLNVQVSNMNVTKSNFSRCFSALTTGPAVALARSGEGVLPSGHFVEVMGATSFSSFFAHSGTFPLTPNTSAPRILDVDASTNYEANFDGAILVRYLLGYRGSALVAGTGSAGSASAIETFIATNLALFDVDGDGRTLALSDGLMILRRLLNPTALSTNAAATAAITANAKRTLRSDEMIVRTIDDLKP